MGLGCSGDPVEGDFVALGPGFGLKLGPMDPGPVGTRIGVLSPHHLRLNLFTVGDIFEGTFSGTPGFLGLKLFVILLFSSVQSNLSQTSTNQRPLVEKGIFPAFPNITALQSGILKIPS